MWRWRRSLSELLLKDLKEKIEKGESVDEGNKIRDFARSFLWGGIFKRYEEIYFNLLNGGSS